MQKDNLKTVFQVLAVAGLAFTGAAAYLMPHVSLLWQVMGAITLLSFGASVWLSRTELKGSLAKRSTRYGLNSLLMTAIVVAIVVMVNLIVVNHDQKWDITKNKIHTLSDQSIKVLKGLTRDVTLKVFVSPAQIPQFNDILDKYTEQSPKVKREFVDVDKDPLLAKQYDVRNFGTIVVESGDRSSRVDASNGSQDPKIEEKLTNAIIHVEKGDKKKVYFISGHGERLLSDNSRVGFSAIKEDLGSSRFNVEDLNLLEKGKIPADADVVILAGPRKEFISSELAAIENYLRGGGKMMILVEPDSTKALQPLLAKYGVTWIDKRVLLENNQLQQIFGGPYAALVSKYQPHDITKEAKDRSVFALSTPLEKSAKVPEGFTVSPLFETSNMSVEGILEGNKLSQNKANVRKGPFTLGFAITGKVAHPEKKETKQGEEAKEGDKQDAEFRLVVVGDADFASNQLRGMGMNSDLFQNMVSWLAKEEDLISVRPKPTDQSEFDVTEQRLRVIYLSSMAILPLAMFISGIAVWRVRRRK